MRVPLPLLSALLVLSPALLAGCIADTIPVPEDAAGLEGGDAGLRLLPPVAALTQCRGNCFEPTVAAAPDGTLYVTDGIAGGIAVSRDGGATFETVPPPPMPPLTPRPAYQNDALVQVDAEGRLYFSALFTPYAYVGTFTMTLLGIQVAMSEDGGKTWAVNTFLSLSSTPQSAPVGNDRQWLAFGPGGEVYLSYKTISPVFVGGVGFLPMAGTVWLARSDDQGRTFSPFRAVTAPEEALGSLIAGAAVVDAEGRVLLPYLTFAGGDGGRLRVGISEDGGKTFTRVDAYVPPGGKRAGTYFPVLAAGPDGVHLAWNDAAGAVLMSTSRDGGRTWSEPVAWSDPAHSVTSSPWVLARADGALDVAYFDLGEDQVSASIHVVRGPADGAPAHRAEAAPLVKGFKGKPAHTDFAHLAHLPGGRVATVWADQEAPAVLLALESA